MRVEEYADLLGWKLRDLSYLPEGIRILFERNQDVREVLFLRAEERAIIWDLHGNERIYRNWDSFAYALSEGRGGEPIESSHKMLVGFRRNGELSWLHAKHLKGAPPAILQLLREDGGWARVLRSLSRSEASPSCDSGESSV